MQERPAIGLTHPEIIPQRFPSSNTWRLLLLSLYYYYHYYYYYYHYYYHILYVHNFGILNIFFYSNTVTIILVIYI